MSNLVKIPVRVATFALALTIYMQVVLPRWTEPGDANIGAGLLAFLVLAVAGFCWALYDGRRDGIVPAVICWGVVSALFAVGWLVVDAISDADASRSVLEGMTADAGLVPFTFGLVFFPAVVGAAIGSTTRSPQPS